MLRVIPKGPCVFKYIDLFYVLTFISVVLTFISVVLTFIRVSARFEESTLRSRAGPSGTLGDPRGPLGTLVDPWGPSDRKSVV